MAHKTHTHRSNESKLKEFSKYQLTHQEAYSWTASGCSLRCFLQGPWALIPTCTHKHQLLYNSRKQLKHSPANTWCSCLLAVGNREEKKSRCNETKILQVVQFMLGTLKKSCELIFLKATNKYRGIANQIDSLLQLPKAFKKVPPRLLIRANYNCDKKIHPWMKNEKTAQGRNKQQPSWQRDQVESCSRGADYVMGKTEAKWDMAHCYSLQVHTAKQWTLFNFLSEREASYKIIIRIPLIWLYLETFLPCYLYCLEENIFQLVNLEQKNIVKSVL